MASILLPCPKCKATGVMLGADPFVTGQEFLEHPKASTKGSILLRVRTRSCQAALPFPRTVAPISVHWDPN